jgi:hypothetical protein
MPITFGTHDMFEYDMKYKVLICQECKYAIQKSALGSHLLRHKIYRSERQRLLSSIAQLELSEPDDVQLPPIGSPPVHGIPIILGHRCTAPGCESLYASTKRMRRHWSESHGVSEPSESFARPVNLQTFFRGNKLRYFEVASPGITVGKPLVPFDGRLAQQQSVNSVASPARSINTSVFSKPSPNDLEMETIRYFYHFTTATSLTLPAENSDPAKHWQIDMVVQALPLRWLMHGLLAISASHLAMLSNDNTTKQVHLERSSRFLQTFRAGWAEVKHDAVEARAGMVKAGAKIFCILQCCYWTFHPLPLDEGMIPELAPFALQSFMMTIQGCVNPNFALHSTFGREDIPKEAFVKARDDIGRSSDATVPIKTLDMLLNCLHTLPYRMAEILDKPDSTQDFLTTLSAIETLVDCCTLSYATNDIGAAWMGMESWLTSLSDHFKQLVSRQNAATLIVFAHWSLLVARAESHCWFLKGSATKLILQIAGKLPKDSSAQNLVETLIE